jgi:putative hydrolase of the HAD superfamily
MNGRDKAGPTVDGADRAGMPEHNGITTVLWDFGGVLTTSPFDAFAAYESANSLPPGFIRRLNSTNPDANAWAGLERGQMTLDEFAVLFEAEAVAAGAAIDARAVIEQLSGELRPGMVEALRRCHERLKTGLLTNNFGRGSDEPSYAGVLEHFDAVIESSKAGCRKPDIRFYELACELLAIDPSEAVFLDDLGVNLKPARALGMRTIKVSDPVRAILDLEAVVGFPLA